MTVRQPHVSPRLEGAPNFRDLGGLPADCGRRVKPRRIFRSEVLARVTGRDQETLRTLAIGAVCDLRTELEQSRRACCWPEGMVVEPVGSISYTDIGAVSPSEWKVRLADPDFGAAGARAALAQIYRGMSQTFAASARAVLHHLADESSAPLLIHCEAGKDRTGFISALVLRTLGVSREAIVADYLLSRERFVVAGAGNGHIESMGSTLSINGREAMAVLAGVSEDLLDSAFAAIDERHGTLDAYLSDVLDFRADERRRLQASLLE